MATTYQIQAGPSPAKYEVVTGTGSVTYNVAIGGRGPAGTNGTPGATEWNQLTGTLDVLPFTTTNGGPQNLGELAWTQADETLSLQLAHGTILQLGEETLYHVENVTGSTIANGTPVSYAGTVGNSGKMRVKPWNGATDDPLIFMGIATSDIETDDAGYVTHFGKVRGINTQAYTANSVLYANPSGTGLTGTQPTGGQYVIAAVCISSATNGTLFVRPTRFGGANWDAINGKPSFGTSSSYNYTQSDTAPVSSANGDKWLDTASGVEYTRYDGQWVSTDSPVPEPDIKADDLDFAGAVEIGTALTDSSVFPVSVDGSNGSRGKSLMSRIPTYVISKLGNAALATTSTGGNGSADSGKVATYNASGDLTCKSLVITGTGFSAGFLGTLLTGNYGYYAPNANGVLAITQNTTGIPDNLVTSSTKTTPIDADSVLMTDSEAAGTPAKRLTFANLWTWILSKLGGNLTIGGTKTWSGQQEATGQAATNGTSLMTRDLGDARYGNFLIGVLENSQTNATTTFADVTGVTISLPVGTYCVEAQVTASPANSSMGHIFRIVASGTGVVNTGYSRVATNGGTANIFTADWGNLSFTDGRQIAGGVSSSKASYYWTYLVKVTSGTATMKMTFAQHTSNASDLTALSGAYIIAKKVL